MATQVIPSSFFEAMRCEGNRSERTLRAYAGDLRDLAAAFPRRNLVELDLIDLRAYLAALARRGLSESTVKRRIAVMKVFYRHLEEEGLIGHSPARQLRKRYIVSRRIPRVMSPRQIESILRVAFVAVSNEQNFPGPRLARRLRNLSIVEVLFSTGIRSDELVKLDLRDIDLERRTLHIKGKGRRERQSYLSSGEVVASLKDYLEQRAALVPTTEAVFLNRYGHRLHVQSVRTVFRALARAANVPPEFTPHCLRHSMATYLVENGADVRSIQEILGHSNIQTTQIYLEVSKRHKQAVLSQFNQRNRFSIRGEQPSDN